MTEEENKPTSRRRGAAVREPSTPETEALAAPDTAERETAPPENARPRTLAAALAALQSQLPTVRKTESAQVATKSGGQYSYTYATLADLSEVVMPLMGPLGLSFTTVPTLRTEIDPDVLDRILTHVVEAAESRHLNSEQAKDLFDRFVKAAPKTVEVFELQYSLLHESGERIDGQYPLPDPTRSTPQEIGSAITYARRYCLGCVTGISVTDDDDGKAAQSQPAAGRQPPEPSGKPWDLLVMEAEGKGDAEQLRNLWNEARSHGELTDALKAKITEAALAVKAKAEADAAAKEAEGSQEQAPAEGTTGDAGDPPADPSADQAEAAGHDQPLPDTPARPRGDDGGNK